MDPPLHPEIRRQLQIASDELGLTSGNIRVLDWGCGSGRTVLALLKEGWNVMGVDIDPEGILCARRLLVSHGFDGDRLVKLLSPSGVADLPDGSFDFIYSQEVFEHVSDPHSVARELRRLTALHGSGFHVFPAPYRPQEPHFFMPFSHWLPKTALRRWYVVFCCLVGIGLSSEVNRKAVRGMSRAQKAEFVYRYSVEHTFYWPASVVGRKLQAAGFKVSYPVLHHRFLTKWSGPIRFLRLTGLVERFLLTFVTIHIHLRAHSQLKAVNE